MLLYGRELLKRFPHLFKSYSHVLVDEVKKRLSRQDPITVADDDHFTFSQFQDTNVVQYDIVKYMAGQDKGLTVVGGNIFTAIGYSKCTHCLLRWI